MRTDGGHGVGERNDVVLKKRQRSPSEQACRNHTKCAVKEKRDRFVLKSHDNGRWQSGWRIRRSKQVWAAEVENEFDVAVGSNVLDSLGSIRRLLDLES